MAFLRFVHGFDFRSFHSSSLTIKFSNSKAVKFEPSNKSHPSNTLDKGLRGWLLEVVYHFTWANRSVHGLGKW